MIERARTAFWFAQRRSHWAQAVELGLRKLRPDHDGAADAARAANWAATHAVPVPQALAAIGLDNAAPGFPAALRQEGEQRARASRAEMGGPGDLDLLHAAVSASGACRVVETGVAYGWSSLAILSALHGRDGARLVSVDMPYPKMGNEAFVGIVVPERLRAPWTLIREPDRNGLRKALSQLGGAVDLAHYDSDKSWWGRRYAFPLIWDALGRGGVFISDDIQDNMGFAAFIDGVNCAFAVTESGGKFVGIARKP
ncbi:class I SAM-dependent methyltransferase [Anianabacter salinae]|uniref:class I SAM-dependent methyltransferase n=1 Tax=Anianabacter salinae TaxID=2851023 RepID=UPI00225E1684|nr:class I SAM-dependent methyltransferase [Anianabacter salinae]MBV0913475.1 class I SAM-dependent methyltransferase [Anianabacter salinae]